MLARFNSLFPLWALLISLIAFFLNAPFAALNDAIVPLLAAVMFMMGLTLTKADVERIVQTDVKVEVNSSLVQLAGFATIGGSVNGGQSANVTLNNSSLGGFALSRSSSLILYASEPSNSITVNGSMGVFSGSHFLAQAATSAGSVSLTTADTIIVQRTAAMLLAGDALQINAADVLVRQNAVLDVIAVLDANFNVESLTLAQGGGARLVIPDAAEGYVANCDDTSWTNGALVCAE